MVQQQTRHRPLEPIESVKCDFDDGMRNNEDSISDYKFNFRFPITEFYWREKESGIFVK